MTTKTTDRLAPRERLLAAANELFYEEGVHTVGIDRVIERAGVAKATLYSAFGSKDELIRAYLMTRYAARRDTMMKAIAHLETPRERLLAVFDVLGESFAKADFHGCAFVNASAEARPGSVIVEATDEYRAWVKSMFAELATDAGIAEPDYLARQLALLYDGAAVSARMDRDPSAATVAQTIARTLVDAAAATNAAT